MQRSLRKRIVSREGAWPGSKGRGATRPYQRGRGVARRKRAAGLQGGRGARQPRGGRRHRAGGQRGAQRRRRGLRGGRGDARGRHGRDPHLLLLFLFRVPLLIFLFRGGGAAAAAALRLPFPQRSVQAEATPRAAHEAPNLGGGFGAQQRRHSREVAAVTAQRCERPSRQHRTT